VDPRGRVPVHGLPLCVALLVEAEAGLEGLAGEPQVQLVSRHPVHEGSPGRLTPQVLRGRCLGLPDLPLELVHHALDGLVPLVLWTQRAVAHPGPGVGVEEQPRMIAPDAPRPVGKHLCRDRTERHQPCNSHRDPGLACHLMPSVCPRTLARPRARPAGEDARAPRGVYSVNSPAAMSCALWSLFHSA